jgi:hypothetical protein
MSAACDDDGIRPGRCRVPDKEELRLAIGHEPEDRRRVRPPGLDEPFEELTVSELVQLRPGSEPAAAYLEATSR